MTPENAFSGVAVITGGGAGLGAALAREAARLGMTVIVSDIASARAKKTAQEITKAGGTAHARATDVRDPDDVEALAAWTYKKFKDVRLLVNNAGVETLGLMSDMSPAHWRTIMDVNVTGVYHGVKAFVPRMIESAKRGQRVCVANVAALAAVGAIPVMSAYTVSKHAVLGMTECLNIEFELANIPIDVSVITPGSIRTQIFDAATASRSADKRRKALSAYLASDGIEPDAAARTIFAELAAGTFWISTHPEQTKASAAARADYLEAMQRPVLRAEIRTMFGL